MPPVIGFQSALAVPNRSQGDQACSFDHHTFSTVLQTMKACFQSLCLEYDKCADVTSVSCTEACLHGKRFVCSWAYVASACQHVLWLCSARPPAGITKTFSLHPRSYLTSGTTSTSLGLACACLWAAFAIACPAGRPYSLARTHVWLNARLLDTPTSPYPTPLHPIPPHRTHPTPSQPPHSTSPHPTPPHATLSHTTSPYCRLLSLSTAQCLAG